MQPNRPTGQFGGSMNDVQRPTPSAQPADVIRPSTESLGRPATMEYTRPRVESPVSAQAPSPSFSPSPAVSPTANDSSFAPQIPPKKKSKKGLLVGIFAFLLVLGAAGAGAYYYFFMMDTNEPAPAVTEPVGQVEESTTVEATPEGVDATIEAIDKNLNSVDDAADFTPNDVSDDALGL